MRLVDVRHQTWMFFLRFRVKMAALFGVGLLVYHHCFLAGSDGPCSQSGCSVFYCETELKWKKEGLQEQDFYIFLD